MPGIEHKTQDESADDKTMRKVQDQSFVIGSRTLVARRDMADNTCAFMKAVDRICDSHHQVSMETTTELDAMSSKVTGPAIYAMNRMGLEHADLLWEPPLGRIW